ncbi:MAG: CDP-alcohol phosphatidyltransferase family protein [Candidatus Aenigmatarchaeota archaeon]
MKSRREKIRKLKISKDLIKLREFLFSGLYLPKVNPNLISSFTVILSIIFILIFDFHRFIAAILLILILILDALDGEIARRYKLNNKEGYIIDVTCDRLSEALIFFPFFFPWFFLFAFNLFLTILSFNKKIHIILPLRHLFLIYFFLFYAL